jgi:hypothetical protein
MEENTASCTHCLTLPLYLPLINYTLPFARAHQPLRDVVRVEERAYKRPLLLGTPARELTTAELSAASGHGWPVEPPFSVAHGRGALQRPRAWTKKALERGISVAWLSGARLKASAAGCQGLPRGAWDVKALSAAGRWANPGGLQAGHCAALALQGLVPQRDPKTAEATEPADLQLSLATSIGKTRAMG